MEKSIPHKEYKTVRFDDKDLFKEAKQRALDEEISLLELIQKAVRKYLKKSY